MCGYLESQGIRATYDKGGMNTFQTLWTGPNLGRQEILVLATDLDAASKALSQINQGEPGTAGNASNTET